MRAIDAHTPQVGQVTGPGEPYPSLIEPGHRAVRERGHRKDSHDVERKAFLAYDDLAMIVVAIAL